jgi:hypothetical protein
VIGRTPIYLNCSIQVGISGCYSFTFYKLSHSSPFTVIFTSRCQFCTLSRNSLMAGDFPNLSSYVISQWPKANIINPVTRTWYPQFSIILAVCTTLILCARLWSQVRKSTNGFGVDDGFGCVAWVRHILQSDFLYTDGNASYLPLSTLYYL